MISSIISRVSAAVLLVGGLSLLFAADVVLPRVIAGYPASGAWLGQLLGAAWLGVAALNWLQRNALLGGIYSRPIVLTNGALYIISALSLSRPLLSGAIPPVLWAAQLPIAALAVTYAALLFRGPFDPLGKAAG